MHNPPCPASSPFTHYSARSAPFHCPSSPYPSILLFLTPTWNEPFLPSHVFALSSSRVPRPLPRRPCPCLYAILGPSLSSTLLPQLWHAPPPSPSPSPPLRPLPISSNAQHSAATWHCPNPGICSRHEPTAAATISLSSLFVAVWPPNG
ncbi:hypothetical protein GQ607_010268 [Colletotrichum asianum]|uniref:Uncharacterized protein n=1 Tax=Colletotrichum asianum TaxID=702518 RepID=A0A8H3WA41_9PEZI|nr:hypothetical protein GQ607_010268 [Colletotrichum asianum]